VSFAVFGGQVWWKIDDLCWKSMEKRE